MGILIKADPDTDLFLGWSKVANNVVWAGTRAEAEHRFSPGQIACAERTGTSSLMALGEFGSPGLIVAGRYWLDRHDLLAYTRLAASGATWTDPRVLTLLQDLADGPLTVTVQYAGSDVDIALDPPLGGPILGGQDEYTDTTPTEGQQ